MNIINVLHLTDLHFKHDTEQTARLHRKMVLRDLISRLEELISFPDPKRARASSDNTPDWKPHYIAVSGDIAYHASWEEYEKEAKPFFDELRAKFPKAEFIACPGNHDRNAKYSAGLVYPKSAMEADDWLSSEQLQPDRGSADQADRDDLARSPLVVPFWNFQRFCKAQNFLRPAIEPGLDYLVGTVESTTFGYPVEFIVLNSAWFCNHRAHTDARNLWLGLPLLQKLETERCESSTAKLRIALIHHPREWLHEDECNSYGDRPNTYRFLAQKCDVILSGHVHGSVEPPSRAYNHAMVYTGGATYVGARWRNNFSLLQFDLEEGVVSRRAFEFDPRIPRWQEVAHGNKTDELYELNSESPRARRNVTQLTDPNLLAGQWSSKFWRESRMEARVYDNVVDFTLTEDKDPITGECFWKGVTRSGGDSGSDNTSEHDFEITATFKDGYLTGTWRGRLRWGAVQLSCLYGESELKMKGRWVGFDGNGDVNVGQWRFRKPNPEGGI